jgi:hypothetical protein
MMKCVGSTLLLAAIALLAGLPGWGAEIEPGFVSLFDGKTLNGWQEPAKPEHRYVVKDGVLAAPPGSGGNLVSEKQYTNFILRFEYRLEPGGNNGIGIRYPGKGDSAYVGMEIQVLDDTHEKYKGKLKPEQHMGSIYGVVPARTGFQKPAGEWNEEEIMADGSHIRITLNGVVIVDFDLALVKEAEVLKKHPGLRNKSGYIALLGHRSLAEFRNIRIRELP